MKLFLDGWFWKLGDNWSEMIFFMRECQSSIMFECFLPNCIFNVHAIVIITYIIHPEQSEGGV